MRSPYAGLANNARYVSGTTGALYNTIAVNTYFGAAAACVIL